MYWTGQPNGENQVEDASTTRDRRVARREKGDFQKAIEDGCCDSEATRGPHQMDHGYTLTRSRR
jgi:hypothetical protein